MNNKTVGEITEQAYPQRAAPLPLRREELDAKRLTELFAYRYPGAIANVLKIVEVIDSHTTKVRIEVEWNQEGRDAGIPAALCLKTNWSGLFANVDITALEARFYFYLRDAMSNLAPACYYADWDHGANQGLIALEDLTQRGGKFGHTSDQVGIDGVAGALEDLAAMHRSWWNSPALKQHTWLPGSMRTPVDTDQLEIMWSYLETNLEDAEHRQVMPDWLLDDPQRFLQAYKALGEFERNQTGPTCLLLGDCHQGNTYILPNGHRLFLDWQLARKGAPWRDITYFMIGALTIDERRSAERQLIGHYHAALAAGGTEAVPSLDTFWDAYRRWVIYGQQAWAANMDQWGQSGIPMLERFFTAGEDLETLRLLEQHS